MPSDSSRWPHLADRVDILEWADRIPTRSELPILIRRLIRKDNDRIAKLNMRGHEGVGLAGYDGEVYAEVASPFVPEGESVWEMGVDKNVKAKADEEYKKRTESPGSVVPSETTFVFVTPRSWPNRDNWAIEKASEGIWKSVIAHDVDSICTAMERSHGLHSWFTGSIGRLASGIETLEEWWTAFVRSRRTVEGQAASLDGREQLSKDLIDLVEARIRIININISSIDELLSFYCAAIMSQPLEAQDSLFSRSFILKTLDAIQHTLIADEELALVPFSERLYRDASNLHKHSVLLVVHESDGADVIVPAPKSVGITQPSSTEEQYQMPIAENVGSRPHGPDFENIEVDENPERDSFLSSIFQSRTIRILWLLRSWNMSRSGDKSIIEKLTGRRWNEIEEELSHIVDSEFSPFLRIGASWTARTTNSTWHNLEPHLNSSDFEILLTGVQIILGSIDPGSRSSLLERWQSPLYSLERIYSQDLRRGVSETLAYMAFRGADRDLFQGLTIRSWVRQSVSILLWRANSDESGDLWELISDVFSPLAEAAPIEFAAETFNGLMQSGSLRKRLFVNSSGQGHRSISNTQVNLLFALEMVAWNPEFLGMSAENIAVLAELDVDGTSGNAPSKSLSKIFLPLRPQTNTPFERQLAVIDGIVERHPRVGWNLLLSLLPTHHSVVFPSTGPKFNNWKPHEENSPLLGEYIQATNDILARSIELANKHSRYWVELTRHLDIVTVEQRENLLQNLGNYETRKIFTDEERFEIYEILSALVRRHREYPDTNWSLAESDLIRISQIADAFQVDSVQLRSKWLFDDQRPDLAIPHDDDDSEYQLKLLSLRKEASAAIFDLGGVEDVIKFAQDVKYPYFLGRSLATAISRQTFSQIFGYLDSENLSMINFAVGYLDQKVADDQDVMEFFSEYSGRPLVLARILSRISDLPRAWTVARELGTEVLQLYWQEFNVNGRGEDFQYLNEATRNLLDHGLILKAIEILSMYSGRGSNPIEPKLIIESLESLSSNEQMTKESSHHLSFTLDRLIKLLVRAGVNSDQIANLEWNLLPALGYGYKIKSIDKLLSSSPEFFLRVLSLVYRSDNDSEELVVDEGASRRAFRVLNDWKHIPGSSASGSTIDAEILKDWVSTVRELATLASRSGVAETVIGQLFANSPLDEDGGWPLIPIRDIIQMSQTEEMGQGFTIGARNLRGVYSRGMTEGGKQEFDLAEKYGEWKGKVADRWPLVASLLDKIAEGYRSEGRREEERLKLRQEGLGE